MYNSPVNKRTTNNTNTKMATISYTAAGRKNSKKNPAIINLTITSDNGEVVEVKIEYTKKYGWTPSAETSERGDFDGDLHTSWGGTKCCYGTMFTIRLKLVK